MKQQLSKYKYYILFYCCITLSLYLNFLCFYSQIGNPLYSPFQSLGPCVYTLINSIIFALPYFLCKKKIYLIFIYLIFIDALLTANVVYYHYYNNIIPFFSYSNITNLSELASTISSYFHIADFVYLLSTILLFVFYLFIFRKKKETFPLKYRVLTPITLIIISVLIVSGGLVIEKIKGITLEQKFYNRDDNQPAFVSYNGILSLWSYQIASHIYSDNKPITHKELNQIHSFILNNYSESTHVMQNKNLIIIVVESLDSWVTKFANGNATPFLNKLSKSNNVIYVPNVLPQINHGRSADAQFIINTGLLPVINNTVANLYSTQYYSSLAEALKKQKNYYSMTIMGNKPTCWNQKTMNISYHIDSLISNENLISNEVIGIGISDKSVFKQAADILNSYRNKPFYCQIITLSSHDGIEFENKPSRLKFPATYPNEIKDYIKSIEYTDSSIELFFNKLQKYNLLENTIVVITGDHAGLSANEIKRFSPELVNRYENSKNTFTPLYIVNSGLNYKQKADQVMGEIDIYPTLIDIMGISQYKWHGIGKSLFSKHPPIFAVNVSSNIIGDTIHTNPTEVKLRKTAWKISDLMIRKQYLKSK